MKIKVINIEYETKDRTMWKACLVASSAQDAVDMIVKNVPTFDRIISIGVYKDVNAITKDVIDYIKGDNKKPSEEVNNDTTETQDDSVKRSHDNDIDENDISDDLKCPVCDKKFMNKRNVIRHFKKFHA